MKEKSLKPNSLLKLEIFEKSQRSAEHVITKPSVSDNVKRMEEKTESVSEFNVNCNFK